MRLLVRCLVVLLLCVEAGCLAAAARADETLPHGEWPLAPRPEVVRRFDPPDGPYAAGHRGVDLLGRPGQPVRTALAGTVSYAGTLAGRGVVSVRHGALRTTYEPVTASVHVGDVVRAGEQLGTLQLGPSHCAPRHCLHWGLIRGETYLDPLLLVGGGPVRLLPLTGTAPSTRAADLRGRTEPSLSRAALRGPPVGQGAGLAVAAAVVAAR